MKRFLRILPFLLPVQGIVAQQPYWQQEVHYTIRVSLNDRAHSLRADMQLTYINHSPDTLTYLWFHLWPNAYRNDRTALARQLAADPESASKTKNADTGYIDSLHFTADGKAVALAPDTAHIDIVRLILPEPLLPGDSVRLATPFYVKLPSYYSRSGYDGGEFMVCQWYPKPAVYDRKGWHPMPYLDEGEFYSEYGTYDVTITVPSAYVVAATGMPGTADELNRYEETGRRNNDSSGAVLAYRPPPGKVKTLHYYGENIHDFAWFADKDFVIRYDTLALSPGRVIDVFSYGQPKGNKEWAGSTRFIKDAVRHYSDWVGAYPYPVVQAVEGPGNFSSGGMEYPMITLITSPDAGKEALDAVIAHEVGHNWFYGALGTNERDHPWMDEGVNSYYQFRYEAEKYRANSLFGDAIPENVRGKSLDQFQEMVYNALSSIPAKEAIETPSTAFPNKDDYSTVVYIKTAIWMYIVETVLGRDRLDKAMQQYFSDWAFKHPYPEDMQASLEKATGLKLDRLFALLHKENNFK